MSVVKRKNNLSPLHVDLRPTPDGQHIQRECKAYQEFCSVAVPVAEAVLERSWYLPVQAREFQESRAVVRGGLKPAAKGYFLSLSFNAARLSWACSLAGSSATAVVRACSACAVLPISMK